MIKSGDLENREFDKNEPEPKGAPEVAAELARMRAVRARAEDNIALLREVRAKLQALKVPESVEATAWTDAIAGLERVIEAFEAR